MVQQLTAAVAIAVLTGVFVWAWTRPRNRPAEQRPGILPNLRPPECGPRVELHLSWRWDCDECGRENYTRGFPPVLTVEEQAAIRRRRGFESFAPGRFIVHPRTVVCGFCGREFNTEPAGGGIVE